MKKKQLLKKITKKFVKRLKKITFLQVSAFLFYAFIFLIPFQVDVIVYARNVFEGGNFNPYTSIFYHLSDIVFLFALIAWGISLLRGEAKHKLTYGRWIIFILLTLFVVAGEVSVLFAGDKWLSFLILIRFVQLLLLYIYMVNDVVKLDIIINVFIASVSVQAAIAIMQYINQGSIGIHFLGEPNIGPNVPGVAKIDLDGEKILRPYGTFQHANILAGYLVSALLLTFYRISQKEHIAYPIAILLIAALVLTFSRSALLSLVVASLVFLSIKNMKISLKYVFLGLSLLILFVVIFNLEQTIISKLLMTDSASFDERVYYFSIAKKMMYVNPLGVGLGNFTLFMPDFTALKLAPWEYQPVHNIYMLLVNEIGIQGFVIFALLLIALAIHLFVHQNKDKAGKSNAGIYLLITLVALSVIGLFDHYLISLYQGQLLLFFVIGLSGKYLMTKNR